MPRRSVYGCAHCARADVKYRAVYALQLEPRNMKTISVQAAVDALGGGTALLCCPHAAIAAMDIDSKGGHLRVVAYNSDGFEVQVHRRLKKCRR